MNVNLGFRLLFLVTIAGGRVLVAQQTLPRDSIKINSSPVDSLKNNFLTSPLSEYIPGDDSPELVSQRLVSLQRTIALPYNSSVHGFINYFTVRDRDYTRMILRRKDLYFPLFEKYLAAYNLPDELKYLAVVESGLNPRAVSGAKAVGLWQFMSATGRYFDLHNDWFEDERMDPEKSTQAACRYLSQLYSIFNDWHLALAAYNSGPGTVNRAIKRSGNKRSFWEIYDVLPAETRSYVPQYIAIIYAVNHAEVHNIIEHYREIAIPHDTLLVNRYLHLPTFANLTGTCVDELQKLNPSIHASIIPQGKTVTLKIPQTAKQALETNRLFILDSASKMGKGELEKIVKSEIGATIGRNPIKYKVKAGEGILTIAKKHAVRIDDIKKWNNLKSNLIHPGKYLVIWVESNTKVNDAATKEKLAIGKIYTVQSGDTLWNISKKFQGLTIDKIKSLNKMKTVKLQPGQKLIVG